MACIAFFIWTSIFLCFERQFLCNTNSHQSIFVKVYLSSTCFSLSILIGYFSSNSFIFSRSWQWNGIEILNQYSSIGSLIVHFVRIVQHIGLTLFRTHVLSHYVQHMKWHACFSFATISTNVFDVCVCVCTSFRFFFFLFWNQPEPKSKFLPSSFTPSPTPS